MRGSWRAGRSPWPRRFLGWVGRCAGLQRARSTARRCAGHVLFVANHESWLDILAVAGATGAAFVAKDEVAALAGDRLARRAEQHASSSPARRGMRSAARPTRSATRWPAAEPVALFPEGTTDGGTRLLPFRASLLASLYPAAARA